MDSPSSLPTTSILSGATVQTAERNEFINTGGNMTKIIVQNFTIDPGSTEARDEVISDTSSEGYELNTVSDTRRGLDVYTFISYFLSLISLTRSPSGAEETTCHDEPPVIVSGIPLDDPLALPIPEASRSPSHKYTRSMLEKGIGYPLYEPQPDCEPSSEYWGKGIRVGDVGIVTADGIFDFLFNVCPAQNSSINPPTIPDDFIEELDCQVRVVEHFQPNACLFSSGVNRSQDPGGRYTCLGPNGAILELPVGATRFEAKDKLPLKRLAARDAEKWYRYTILNMGRDVQNGSLYLVTTCIKCTYWGIAVFERPSAPDCLRFTIDEGFAEQNQNLRPNCSWEGFGAFITRVTPNSNNLGSNNADSDTLNQCVFLRGYKIELRKDIWNDIENPQSSESTTIFYRTTSSAADKGKGSTNKLKFSNQNDHSQPGTGFRSSSAFRTTSLAQDVVMYGTTASPVEPPRVTVHADFSLSLEHPSDLINAALLSQRLDARVALTHDDDWCDMIQGNFSELKYEDLSKVALSYTSMLDQFGCVSLERTGQLTHEQSDLVVHEQDEPSDVEVTDIQGFRVDYESDEPSDVEKIYTPTIKERIISFTDQEPKYIPQLDYSGRVIFVYERATDIPAWVIDTLKRHSLNANTILPQIEKSRQSPPDAPQLWIVYAPDRKIEYILSVTEFIIDSYPVFIFTTKKPSTLTGNKFIGQMNELADELHRHIDTKRVYSVFAPLSITTTFCEIWSKITGISTIKMPYYDVNIRRCTRQTFKKNQRQPVGYEWGMRLANPSDRHMVAELCRSLSDESEPFVLNDEEADLEAEYLINNKLVWVYTIREPGEPYYEIASIVACTRNMEQVGVITKVYTAVKWRGKGCAGQLTAYVCEKLFAAGKENLVLYVGVDNPARRMYDKIGFVGVDIDESLDRWCEIGFDRGYVELGHW